MSGNPLDMLKDTALNFATGGLYSIYKAATSDHPMQSLMAQGLDVGVAAAGNTLATDIGGPLAGTAFNAVGGLAGAAGGAGAFAGTAAAGAEGAPAASALTEAGTVAGGGAVNIAPGAAESASTADVAGASLNGPVGSVAPTEVASTAPGGVGNMVGADAGTGVGGEPLTGLANTPPDSTAPAPLDCHYTPVRPECGAHERKRTAFTNEIGSKAGDLNGMDTKSWFASLSPGAQTALVTGGFAGAQMLTGGMQGLFAGVSAQKRLELDQLINSQYQNQVQYKNKNNQYAPLLTFKAPPNGLAQTPGA